MKKTLVALAALAATTAFAQSTVTISGNVDLGMRNLKETSTNAFGGAGSTVERKQSGPNGNGAAGWTSSALKLSVVEDMGGGTTAGYVGEMNLNTFGAGVDNANQQLGTGRQAYGFLADKQLGEFRLGYQYTTDDQIQGGVGRATPTGNVGGRFQNFAVNRSGAANAIATAVASDNVVRVNGAEYSKSFGATTAIVQWGRQTDKTDGSAATVDTVANGTWTSVAAKYVQGPLTLGASFATLNTETNTIGNANAQASNKRKLRTYAANYDFGVAKAFFNYTDRTNQAAALDVDTTKQTTKGYDLGVSVPMGKTTLFAATGNGDLKIKNAAGVDTTNWGVKTRLLGATYDFSKRTSLNAYYATTKANDELPASIGESNKRTMVGAGLRHQF